MAESIRIRWNSVKKAADRYVGLQDGRVWCVWNRDWSTCRVVFDLREWCVGVSWKRNIYFTFRNGSVRTLQLRTQLLPCVYVLWNWAWPDSYEPNGIADSD